MIGPLLKQSLLHMVRSKLLIGVLFFSISFQYLGIRIVRALSEGANVKLGGMVKLIGESEGLLVGLAVAVFASGFITFIYGVWMAPYAHRGSRGELTFSLPVNKWAYLVAYGLALTSLFVLQHVILFFCIGLNFGWTVFATLDFPWIAWLLVFTQHAIAFSAIAFGLAACSLWIGPMPTIVALSVGSVLVQSTQIIFYVQREFEVEVFSEKFGFLENVLSVFPPVGELLTNLKLVVSGGATLEPFILWIGWFGISAVWFRFMLRNPPKRRASEG